MKILYPNNNTRSIRTIVMLLICLLVAIFKLSASPVASTFTCDAEIFYHNDHADSTTFTFAALTDAEGLTYEWLINEEQVSTDSTFTYDFPETGLYLVELITFDSDQNECATREFVEVGFSGVECDLEIFYHNDHADSTTFTFVALTEAEGLTYEWSINEEQVSTDSTFTYDFPETGLYLVELITYDSDQNECFVKEFVEVGFSEIGCDLEIFYHNDHADSTTFTFAALTDKEGLTYGWFIDEEEISADSTFNYDFPEAGIYLVELITYDSDQNECATREFVEVGFSNTDCDLDIFYHNDHADSTTYTFAVLTDAEGLTYEWYIDEELVSTDSTFTYDFPEAGIYVVDLITFDSDQNECRIHECIEVGFVETECDVQIFYNNDFADSATYIFKAYPNIEGLTYEWFINEEQVSTDSAFIYEFEESGPYLIELITYDSEQNECVRELFVQVGVTEVECDLEIFYHNDHADSTTFTFAALTDAERLMYEWYINEDHVSEDSTFTYNFPEAGLYLVELITYDSEQNECYVKEFIEVTDEQEACDATFTFINETGNYYTFTANADGEAVEFEWEIDGEFVSADSSFEYHFKEAGNYEVVLTVYDEEQNSCTSEELIQVTEPSADSLYIRGYLFADVLPVDNGVVELYREENQEWIKVMETGTFNGEYEFDDLVRGKYLIHARGNEQVHFAFIPTYFVNGISWFDAYHLDLEHPVEEVKITLIRSEELNATGQGALRGSIAAGEEIVPNIVLLKDQASGKVMRWTVTDANHGFSFDGLPYGRYKVTAEKPGVSFSQSFELTEARPEILDFEMNPGVVSDVRDLLNLSTLNVYPTKFNDEIHLENKGYTSENLLIELVSTSGKQVMSQQITLGVAESKTIKIYDTNRGLLIMKVRNEKGKVLTKRLIKE
ncbi:MAG: PKD-like domain-containing protein [Bacteroidota bacterium]